MSLRVVPVTFAQACAFITDWHRHHRPPQGHKYSLGVADGEVLVGVAVVGRPVARMLDDGQTLEVTRVTVANATPNACSLLYAAAWRAAKALGYRRLVTYTQKVLGFTNSEVLKAVNWSSVGRRSAYVGASVRELMTPLGIGMHASDFKTRVSRERRPIPAPRARRSPSNSTAAARAVAGTAPSPCRLGAGAVRVARFWAAIRFARHRSGPESLVISDHRPPRKDPCGAVLGR